MKVKSFMKIKILSVILLLLCFFAGCTKNVSTTEPTEKLYKPAQSDSTVTYTAYTGYTLYPMKPGSAWTYAAYDSVGRQTDTVNLRVLNTFQVGSEIQSLWLICGKTETDSIWVVESNDTVSFHFQRAYYLDDMTLLYPLTIGNSWRYQFGNITVKSDESVSTPAGTFLSCKHIKRFGFVTNEITDEEFWIDPNAGIVKIIQKDFVTVENGYETNKIWTLVSYNIK